MRLEWFLSVIALVVSLLGTSGMVNAQKTKRIEAAVETHGVTFYEHAGFTGASKTITSDWDLNMNMDWNDRISSIRVPAGYKIQVFEHLFNGASMELTSDWSAAENSPLAFNDIISSIRIVSRPGQSQAAQSDWTATGFSSIGQQGTYTSWADKWQLPTPGKAAILFKASAKNDIHIAFADAAKTMDPMYEIVIGGWGNTKCAIRRRSQGPPIQESAGAVRKPGLADDYWAMVDKDKGVISAGFGNVVGQNVIVETKDANFLANVRYFALSSWDTPIEYTDVRTAALAEDKPTGVYARALKPVYKKDEKIVVEYNDFPTEWSPWINIVQKGTRDDEWGNYQYTKGKSGKLEFEFTWGLEPGDYEVRGYFSSSDYTVKARYAFKVVE